MTDSGHGAMLVAHIWASANTQSLHQSSLPPLMVSCHRVGVFLYFFFFENKTALFDHSGPNLSSAYWVFVGHEMPECGAGLSVTLGIGKKLAELICSYDLSVGVGKVVERSREPTTFPPKIL